MTAAKQRKPQTPELCPGDCFTLPGVMRGRNGQLVIDGINPATKRRCKGVKMAIYVLGELVLKG